MSKKSGKVKIHTTITRDANDKLRSMVSGYGDLGRVLSEAILLYYESRKNA